MAVALEHMAAREGILTGSQQPQKRTRERGNDDEGPPDKHNDFSKSRSAFYDSLCYNYYYYIDPRKSKKKKRVTEDAVSSSSKYYVQ